MPGDTGVLLISTIPGIIYNIMEVGYLVSCEPLLVMRHFLPFLKKQEIEMDFFNAVNGIWTTRKGPIHLLSSFPPKLNHLLVKMQKQKCLKMQQIFLKEIYKVAY